MGNDDYEPAPVVNLRTAEEVARAREQLRAFRDAPLGSVEALIRFSLENALRALAEAEARSAAASASTPTTADAEDGDGRKRTPSQ